MLADRYLFRQIVFVNGEVILVSNGPIIDRTKTKLFYGAGLRRLGQNNLVTVYLDGEDSKNVILKILIYNHSSVLTEEWMY
jgi:hypothetical protein